MALIVQKFGGTSVADLERIRHAADKAIAARDAGHQVVVVLSAMSGETNRLLAMGQQMAAQPDSREMDQLAATGEQVTIALMAIHLNGRGYPAVSLQGWQVPIATNAVHGKARIEQIDSEHLHRLLNDGKIVVVAGFQGVSSEGNITTLGRGGSDTTAVALAAALNADECQIFTDVDGVYTTDPRMVPEAHRLDSITFKEMLELASQGSKVLQTRSVEFAGKYRVPLRVLSTFVDGPGTLISVEQGMEAPLVSGVACSRQEAWITVAHMPDTPFSASRVFGTLARAHIEVDMITQTPNAHQRTDFSFSVSRTDVTQAISVLAGALPELPAEAISVNNDVAKVSVIGVALRSHPELVMKLFDALAAEQIRLLAITTSESRISVLVPDTETERSVRTLHRAFGLSVAVKAE